MLTDLKIQMSLCQLLFLSLYYKQLCSGHSLYRRSWGLNLLVFLSRVFIPTAPMSCFTVCDGLTDGVCPTYLPSNVSWGRLHLAQPP